MTDLYVQLKQLHQEQFDWTQERVLVYRGRRMLPAEFEKLKASIGGLVVTKSFLSTTTERDVAVVYSGKDTSDPNIVPAIIHMRIDKQKNETKPFAFIRYHSKVREDDEVLISIGTIFRIIEENYKNGVHEFVLVRSDTEEQLEHKIKEDFRSQISESETFLNVDSSTDIVKLCKEALDVSTSFDDHITKQHEGSVSSKILETKNTGIDLFSFSI
ncbi:unnamed protein product [Rotaria sp. Silwood2]|nr:unnamed protein product [Rotaria sp. Silwood2]CAF3007036.1 unnamed protein product [Rotaria sp. Silwood2]CAF3260547.1 unnamed protein product [Rotaria sp. Silwood2]CAF3349679.1 unnamed protein product [Rotaria sp. Silwood2]CAF4361492.1 unnamed protein product [Rotaria sp. Silwood2]